MLHKSVVAACFLFLLLLVSTGSASAHTSDKVYTADRFDVAAQVLATNTVRVTETEVFHFSGGTFSFVTRALPTDNTDGINILSASMDQQSMSEGNAAGQYEVKDGNPITVTWHFLVQPDTTHTFTLVYEIDGLVQMHPQQDLIDWKPLPNQHSYPIQSSTITITYPQSAALLQKPEVDQGTATVSTTPGQVIYQASNLQADQFLELGLRFRPGLVSQEPTWQQNADISANWWPLLLLVGVLIALPGTFFFVWFQRRYRRSSPNAVQLAEAGITTPPGDLPPALAGVLVKADGGDPSWSQVLAAIFSLMDRGVIAIAPPAQEGWYVGKSDFNLMLLNQPPALCYHEAELVQLLFEKQSGDVKPLISIEQAGKRYQQKSNAFARSVQKEMIQREIMDRRRLGTRRRLGCLSLIVVPAFVLIFILPQLAPWPCIFPLIGLLIVFVASSVTRNAISVYNEQNEQIAFRWQAFAEHLHRLVSRQAVPTVEDFAYLSYATAFDLTEEWISMMQHYGIQALPSWFRELMTAGYIHERQVYFEFHRMYHTAHRAGQRSSSSGGNGGGSSMSGSSGAAGGGSSSAG